MRLKELECELQQVQGFETPKVMLEQVYILNIDQLVYYITTYRCTSFIQRCDNAR